LGICGKNIREEVSSPLSSLYFMGLYISNKEIQGNNQGNNPGFGYNRVYRASNNL
jgi:hypothetical protein